MKAAVRCRSLTLGGAGPNTLEAQEKHGKRLDGTSKQRKVREAIPLVIGSLNLRAEYDKHMQGVKQNAGCKRPVLHFIIKFPDEILSTTPPGPFAKIADLNERKKLMLRQAYHFINKTHGGDAVFAARVDRDEEGELVVDVFAAPKYEKRTKRHTCVWSSPSKFGKELALVHAEEIQRRHPKAEGVLTGPRHVGIALQAEFSVFFERENGTSLTRKLKEDSQPDRLETEALKRITNLETAQRDKQKALEQDQRLLEADRAALAAERVAFEAEKSRIKEDAAKVAGAVTSVILGVITGETRPPEAKGKGWTVAIEHKDIIRPFWNIIRPAVARIHYMWSAIQDAVRSTDKEARHADDYEPSIATAKLTAAVAARKEADKVMKAVQARGFDPDGP